MMTLAVIMLPTSRPLRLPSSICMGFFRCLRSYGLHDEFAILDIELDGIAIVNGTLKNAAGDAILDLLLDDAPEGACSKLRVVAHLSQQVACGVREFQGDVPLGQAWAQAIDLNVHNVLHLLTRDLMEDDDLIDAVDKLRTEALFPQPLTHQALDLGFIHAVKLVEPARSDVTGHNDDR